MRTTRLMLSISLTLLVHGSVRAQEAAPVEHGPAEHGQLIVTVSVDWEGGSLAERDLAEMIALREAFSEVPLTHFLNAAYFTRDAEPDELVRKIRTVVIDGDEVGLHVHCWRGLVEASGVEFRDRPTFWGRPSVARGGREPGHDVELDAYDVAEIQKIVAFSKRTLAGHGFELSASFRCPGWLASANVLEAVRAEGMTIDSSATDGRWHAEELQGVPILDRIRELWPGVTDSSQPFVIETKAGELLEMPDTGALADYVTGKEMIEHLRTQLEAITDGVDRFAHIGFHQETAARYVPRVAECLERWSGDERVRFVTLRDAAELFRGELATVGAGAGDGKSPGAR